MPDGSSMNFGNARAWSAVFLHRGADQALAQQDMGIDFDRLAALWEPLHAELIDESIHPSTRDRPLVPL